jgi:hypothetical protein
MDTPRAAFPASTPVSSLSSWVADQKLTIERRACPGFSGAFFEVQLREWYRQRIRDGEVPD